MDEDICNVALVGIAEAQGDAAAIYAVLKRLREAAEREALERAAGGFTGAMGFETFLGANVARTLRQLAPTP